MRYEQTIEISRLRDGANSYIHIKYSPDGFVFSDNDGEKPDRYMGVYYDSIEEDSMNFNDYRWQKVVGDDSYTVLLDNENISFSVNENNFPIGTQTYIITPQIFRGTEHVTDYTLKDLVSSQGIEFLLSEDEKSLIVSVYQSQAIASNNGELHFSIYLPDVVFDKYIAYSVSVKGEAGESGVSISSHDTYFYLSDSPTELTGGEWETTVVWNSGKYVWSKYITSYSDGSSVESSPVCIAGSKGSTILSIKELYYQSESKDSQDIPEPIMDSEGHFINGWSETAPVWEYGKYMWSCIQIVYDNPHTVEYTTLYCDTSWEAANIVNEALLETKRELTESIGGVESIANANKMSITNRVWQSDIVASISGINNGGINLVDYSDIKIYRAGALYPNQGSIVVSGNVIYVNADPNVYPGCRINVTGLWDSPNTVKTVVVKGYYSYKNNSIIDPHEYENVLIKYVCYGENDTLVQSETTNTLTFSDGLNEFVSILSMPTNTEYVIMGLGQEFSRPYKIESLSVYDGYVYDLTGSIRDRSVSQQQTLDGIVTEVADIETQINGEGETSINSRINRIINDADGMHQTIERIDSEVGQYSTQIDFLAGKVSFVVSGDGETSSFAISPEAIQSITNQFIITDSSGSSTIIEGGKILASSITADMLNTDAIKSRNYVLNDKYTEDDSVFSDSGTFLNLRDGMIRSKNFLLNQEGNVYVNGEINATKLYVGKLSEGVLSDRTYKLKLANGYIKVDMWNGEYIYFDGKKIYMKTQNFEIDGSGNVTIRGDVTANSLMLGDNVKIPTGNITGLSEIATSGNYADLIGAPDLTDVMYLGDITINSETLQNGLVKRTISIGDEYNYTTYDSPDGSYVLHNVGIGNALQGSYFMVSSEGLLRANNAIIYGTVYASEGKFTGDIVAKRMFLGDYAAYIQQNLENLFSDNPTDKQNAETALAALTSNYIVFDGSSLKIKASDITITGVGNISTELSSLSTRISNITDWSSLTYQDVFNKLTNNGAIQGIYTETDSLGNTNFFVNASYIHGGYISTDVLRVGAGVNLLDYPPDNYTKDTNGYFVTTETGTEIALCGYRKNIFAKNDSVYFSVTATNTSATASNIYLTIKFYNANNTFLCSESCVSTAIAGNASNVEIEETFKLTNNNISTAEYYVLYFSTSNQGGLTNIKLYSPIVYKQNSMVMIEDGCITADKISINDLYTLNANIGGFYIYQDGLVASYDTTVNGVDKEFIFELAAKNYSSSGSANAAPILIRDRPEYNTYFYVSFLGRLYAKSEIKTEGKVFTDNGIWRNINYTDLSLLEQDESSTATDRVLHLANNNYTDSITLHHNTKVDGSISVSGSIFLQSTIESIVGNTRAQIINQIVSSTATDRFLKIAYNDYTYAIDLQKNVYARYDLIVSGNLYSPNGVIQTSDEKEKTIVDSLNLDKYKQLLMGIDAFSFKWKNNMDNFIHFGVSAQKTNALINQLGLEDLFMVREHEDSYVVSYSDLQMLIIPVIQEHEREITELKNRIKTLESLLSIE